MVLPSLKKNIYIACVFIASLCPLFTCVVSHVLSLHALCEVSSILYDLIPLFSAPYCEYSSSVYLSNVMCVHKNVYLILVFITSI